MELTYYVLEVNGKFKGNYSNKKDAVHDYYLSNEVYKTDIYRVVVKDRETIKTKLDLPDTKLKEIMWFEVSGTSPYLNYKRKYRTLEDARNDSNAKEGSIYMCIIDNISFKIERNKVF